MNQNVVVVLNLVWILTKVKFEARKKVTKEPTFWQIFQIKIFCEKSNKVYNSQIPLSGRYSFRKVFKKVSSLAFIAAIPT